MSTDGLLSDNIKLLNLNVRSIKNKGIQILTLIQTYDADINIFTKTRHNQGSKLKLNRTNFEYTRERGAIG
jgi:hypothetical protein